MALAMLACACGETDIRPGSAGDLPGLTKQGFTAAMTAAGYTCGHDGRCDGTPGGDNEIAWFDGHSLTARVFD
jgi:hypothetical protein